MPIHDWSRVPAGIFHHFHQDWTIELSRALNRGVLPKGLSALVEQRVGSVEADVLTVQRPSRSTPESGETQLLERPTAQVTRRTDRSLYARRANRIAITHHLGRVVAVIEVVSPGNKDSRGAIGDFVEKTAAYLFRGIHVLVVDLFPPTPRDPQGIHELIWNEFGEEEKYAFPPGKDRMIVSYETGDDGLGAFLEPRAVGDALPEIPLFVGRDQHIRVPLEATYNAAWEASPEDLRTVVATGVMPDTET